MKKLSELAYQLYRLGLEKEAEAVDDLEDIIKNAAKKKKKSNSKKKKEKRDACYYKVKARYDVWPSAYASGALVKCRQVGAKNWGEGGKKKKKNK